MATMSFVAYAMRAAASLPSIVIIRRGMTLFEIVALHTAGRLQLSQPVEDWIGESLQRPGVRLAELSRVAAVDAGFIPRSALPDPVDRLLVATARALDATLLTGDSAIRHYAARTGNVRVQDVAL